LPAGSVGLSAGKLPPKRGPAVSFDVPSKRFSLGKSAKVRPKPRYFRYMKWFHSLGPWLLTMNILSISLRWEFLPACRRCYVQVFEHSFRYLAATARTSHTPFALNQNLAPSTCMRCESTSRMTGARAVFPPPLPSRYRATGARDSASLAAIPDAESRGHLLPQCREIGEKGAFSAEAVGLPRASDLDSRVLDARRRTRRSAVCRSFERFQAVARRK
jgi:hypothetical protein